VPSKDVGVSGGADWGWVTACGEGKEEGGEGVWAKAAREGNLNVRYEADDVGLVAHALKLLGRTCKRWQRWFFWGG